MDQKNDVAFASLSLEAQVDFVIKLFRDAEHLARRDSSLLEKYRSLSSNCGSKKDEVRAYLKFSEELRFKLPGFKAYIDHQSRFVQSGYAANHLIFISQDVEQIEKFINKIPSSEVQKLYQNL